jgi:hypothetical protein
MFDQVRVVGLTFADSLCMVRFAVPKSKQGRFAVHGLRTGQTMTQDVWDPIGPWTSAGGPG